MLALRQPPSSLAAGEPFMVTFMALVVMALLIFSQLNRVLVG
jgi:hypothetical protein